MPQVHTCNALFICLFILLGLESNYMIYLIMWYVVILLSGFILLFNRIWLKIE